MPNGGGNDGDALSVEIRVSPVERGAFLMLARAPTLVAKRPDYEELASNLNV